MNRNVGIGIGAAAVFAVVVAGLLSVLPGQRRSTDYLVIGAIATLACLLFLFVMLIGRSSPAGPFFKRRKTPPRKPGLGLRD